MGTITLDGQEYEYGNGVTLDQVKKYHAKTFQQPKKIQEKKPGYFETGLPRGIASELKKSKAGFQEFVTGKPVDYRMPESRQDIGEIAREYAGAGLTHLGKTITGAVGGYKAGRPFGPMGGAIGGLLGAFGSQYLTQPGPRVGLERIGAGSLGALEALMAGTGHPERLNIAKQIREQEKMMPEYASKLLSQEEEKQAAKEYLNLEKQKASEEIGTTSVGGLKRKSKEAQEKLKELPTEQKLQSLDVREGRPVLPLLAPEKGKGPFDIAQQKAEAAKTNLQNILMQPEGAPTHETNIYNLIEKDLAEKQKALGSQYQEFKQKHIGQKIETGIAKSADQIINEIPEPTSSELFGMGAKSREELAHDVNSKIIKETKDVSDIFDNWRSLKRYAQRARGKARAAGEDLSPDERNELIATADKYDSAALKLEKLIAENDARNNTKYGESLKELKNINERYAKEYAPIYDTDVFWSMKKQKTAPANFLKKLEGSHAGKKILRNIVENNSELLRSSLGQMLVENPEIALKPSKKAFFNPYIEKHEPTKKWLESLKSSLKELPLAEKQQNELIQESLRIQSAGKEILENIRLKKEVPIQKAELQKTINKSNEYIARLTRAIENQKQKMRATQLTKKEQTLAQKKLSQLEDQKEKLNVIQNGLLLTGGKYLGYLTKPIKTIKKTLK